MLGRCVFFARSFNFNEPSRRGTDRVSPNTKIVLKTLRSVAANRLARALHLFKDESDTLYRLHGTPETSSIGRTVSRGCVHLVNHNIIDLYSRVRSGSSILVI